MAFLSKYGAARHIYVPMIKRGVVDFALSADWTPAAGDVKISKDGGAAANVTNLPAAITMGNTAMWDFSITATEMQAAQIHVTVADSSTKAVEDTMFIVETYGNASAQHAVDLSDSVRAGLTSLPNATAGASSGLHINGSNSGTTTYAAMTITGALTVSDGIAVTRSTSNSSAITATGNGTGSGIVATSGSGATGDGMKAVAASTNGNGLTLTKTGTGSDLNAASTLLTVPTVTNLTNAPTSGDFTAAMKTSLNAATPVATVSGDFSATMKTSLNAATPVATVSGDFSATMKTSLGTAVGTAQTGDSYARLGAPAGASVSADVAAVKTDTGNLVTRITSSLFSGITSLAQWLGAGFGKQTANSTAITEIRATGAGSGTFDATTDSQEALRDRGDAAWITATGFAVPGDAMALVNDAVDALAMADSGTAEIAAAIQSAAATTPLAANVKKINDVAVTGTGTLGDEWGP